MIIIIHQNVHEDMSNNTFLYKNWFFLNKRLKFEKKTAGIKL